MNYLRRSEVDVENCYRFPSPTGVTYYESNTSHQSQLEKEGFRPQQGLLIMNYLLEIIGTQRKWKRFRPQQGLTIMNNKKDILESLFETLSFRPQQGLTIMNP